LTNIKELEKLFFKVIDDLKEYLPYLVLVGGWVPYLYVKYLWKNLSVYPVTTTDIDFGVFESERTPSVSEPIYSRLSKLQYKERHLKMGRLFPVAPLLEDAEKKTRLMIEFITAPEVKKSYIEGLLGNQIFVNRLKKFDIILRNSIKLDLGKNGGTSYLLNVPPPYLFLFHKAITFVNREDEGKKAKDLYYIYYILRFHPRIELLFNDLRALNLPGEKVQAVANLRGFFSRVTSQGCLMIEQENGPDDYIYDVREDAFERFIELFNVLEVKMV